MLTLCPAFQFLISAAGQSRELASGAKDKTVKIETALNHQNRVKGRLADLYRSARYGLTVGELGQKRVEILETVSHCPEWVRSYRSGWTDYADTVIQSELVFFYTLPDGSLVSVNRDRSDYYEKKGLGPKEVYEKATASGHYWVGKGLGSFPFPNPKPFYVGAMENGKFK